MNREFLERHIALEHSQPALLESKFEAKEPVATQVRGSGSEDHSESGSETLSGSDNDATDDIVSCYVCFAYVHRASFQRHLQQEHYQKESEGKVKSYLATVSEETSSVEQGFPVTGFYTSVSDSMLHETAEPMPKSRSRFDSLSPDQGYESNGSYMLQRYLFDNSLKS